MTLIITQNDYAARRHQVKPLPDGIVTDQAFSHAKRLRNLLTVFLVAFTACQPDREIDKPLVLKLGHVYEVQAPTHRYGTSQLPGRLELAGVEMSVTVFPAAQLGSEEELLEQVVAGELELAIAGPSFLAMWHPPLGVFDAAYAFRDTDQMLEVANSQLMAEHWERLRVQYGVRVLDTWAYGTRHVTSHKPIRSPSDMRGMRLRLPSARIWQASGEALGASPMPIAFGEVYMALQQGIADGQENPIPVIFSKGFHEVQKYLNLTGHNESSIQVLINDKTWNRLSPEQQQTLVVTVRELGREVYEGNLLEERQLLQKWQQDGTMEVVSSIDVEAFRTKAYEYFAKGFPFSSLYRAIREQPSAHKGLPDDRRNFDL